MPLDLEPLELEPVGSKLDLEPLDLEPVSDPRAARRADLQAQQAAARSAGETTSFSARAAAGIEQGLRTPEAMVRGGLDALQYYRALDAVTGSGDRFQRQNEAELRAMRDRDAFLARETQAIEGRDGRNFVGDLVQGVARGVVELPPQLMAGAAGAMRGAAVQASAAMGGVQGGLSQYAQERGEGRSQLEALPPAVASGLITAVTTRRFGDTGIESVFRNEGVQGVRSGLLQVFKQAGLEGAEEFVDQVQQDLLERATRNPGKPFGESVYDSLLALGVGTVIGGAATAPRLIQRGNRPVIVNEQTGTTDFPPLEGDELPPPPPPAPPAGPANVPPPMRGEAAMETRPSASWTPDGPRTPAVAPELADAIAAIRAGYNPEVDAPALSAPAPTLNPTPNPALDEVTAAPRARRMTPIEREIQDAEAGLWALGGLQPRFLEAIRAQAEKSQWSNAEYLEQLKRTLEKLTRDRAINVVAQRSPAPALPSPPTLNPTPNPAPVSSSLTQRPEATMETRPAAPLGLQREPTVSPELADAIAAVRGGYNPQVESEKPLAQAATEVKPSPAVKISSVPQEAWEIWAENLASDLDSFHPARDGGRDYDLIDAAQNFFDKARIEGGKTVWEAWTDFKAEYQGPQTHLRKIQTSLTEAGFKPSGKKTSPPPAPKTPPDQSGGPSAQPAQAATVGNSAIDAAIAALDAAKIKTQGIYTLPDLGLTVTLWNGSLDAAKLALRAGRSLAQAVEAGIDWLRAQGQRFDEARVRTALEQTVKADARIAATKARTVAGRTVGTSNPTTKRRSGEGTDPDHNVSLQRLRARNPEAYRKNALLLTRYPLVAREYPDLAERMRAIDSPYEAAEERYENAKEKLEEAKSKVEKALAGLLERKANSIKAAEVEAWMRSDPNSKLTVAVRNAQELVATRKAQRDEAADRRSERIDALAESKRLLPLEDADRIYESYIKVVESNLEALIKLASTTWRDTARLWYDGANLIAQDFARQFGATLEQASAVLAVFSPQKDWFMNVALARRMMNIWQNDQNTRWSPEMSRQFIKRSGEPQPVEDKETGQFVTSPKLVSEWNPDGIKYDKGARPGPPDADGNPTWLNWDNDKAAKNLAEARELLKVLEGRTLAELKNPALQARFIRMLSEVRDNPNYPKVTPDGQFGELMRNENGKVLKIAWGGFNTIEKAIAVMSSRLELKSGQVLTSEADVISAALGAQHKVRSFYNNIVDPANTSGHVTMDTHAIAALLWMPLSGASPEVTQNFGGAGTMNDGELGIKGMYAANAEAYRRAAVAPYISLLPREVQSITWEAVRMLFPAKWKADKTNVAKVRDIWEQYRRNELTIDQARNAVFQLVFGRDLAGAIADDSGVGSPSWTDAMGDSLPDSGFAQEANDARVVSDARGAWGPGSGRGAGSAGSVGGGGNPAAVVRPAAEGVVEDTWKSAHGESLGYVGGVSDEGAVRSAFGDLSKISHSSTGLHGADNSWRYSKAERTVYWWWDPTEVQRESVAAHLERKGERPQFNKPINSVGTKTFDAAHGGPKERRRLVVDGVAGEYYVRDADTASAVHLPFRTKSEAVAWMESRNSALSDKSSIDSAIAALEAAKVKPGGLYALPDLGLTVTLWNGTLTAAQVALRAGRSLAQAVQAGVDWLRAQGQAFDEAKVRAALEQGILQAPGIREHVGKRLLQEDFSPAAKAALEPLLRYEVKPDAQLFAEAAAVVEAIGPMEAEANYFGNPWGLPADAHVVLGFAIGNGLSTLEAQARAAGDTALADRIGRQNAEFQSQFVLQSTETARTLRAYRYFDLVGNLSPFTADLFARKVIEQASQKQKQRIKPALDKGPDGEPGLTDRLNEINRAGIEEAARTPEVQGAARTAINQAIEEEARTAGTPLQQAIAAEVVAQLQTAGRLNAVEAAIVREHFGQNPEPLALADKLERAGVKPAKARAAELEGKYKDGVEALRAKLRQKLAEARKKDIDPATLGIVDKAIRQRLAELQVKLGALVRQHWTEQERVGRTLAESLVQEAGLPEAQATRLADAIQRRFKALVQARKEQALRNLAKTPAARELQKPSVAQRIIEATNLGALDSEGLWQAVADKLGLPTYTAEASAEVKRLADRAQQLPEGSVQRRKATADMMNYIARRKGVKRGDLAWAFWYGNVLSDPRTWAVNFGDTGLNALASTAAVFTTEPGGVPQAIRQVPRAVGKGMAEAREVWRTGQDLRTHKEGDLSAPVLALYDRKAGFGPMMAWLYSNVGKVMTATDVFWQQATREMKAVQLARIMAKEEGLTGNTLRLRVEEILNNTTERRGQLEAQLQREAAQMRAAGMEPDALWEQRRIYQLEEELRGPELEARANDFAARTAYNNEPYGVMGAVTNAIELGTRAMEAQAAKTGNERTAALASLARRFVIPFTRIPANAWNERLNYTPLGLARGTWAVLRARVMPDGQQRLYGREVQPGDVAEVLVKGAAGTLAMATMVLAGLKALDDDEGWQIHGAGPRNSDHRKTLRGTGWIPFSFQKGDKFVSFANTPFAAAFAMVGNYVDRHRYKDTDADGALNEARLAAMGAVQVFEQQTYIDAVARTLGLLDNVNDKTPVRMAEVLGRGSASFVPVAGANVLRGVDRADDPKVYQAKTVSDALLFGFPFVRRIGQPALNEFGEPVTLNPMARFYTARKEDVLVDLVRRGIYPTKPNKAVNRLGREMTDDEHYRYVQESGQAIKRRLETPGMRQMIRSGKEEDARKAVTAIVREERERARRRLGF